MSYPAILDQTVADGLFLGRVSGKAAWTAIPSVDLSGYVATSRTVNGHALSGDVTVSASDVGLGNVENTALSTWAGSANITTVGSDCVMTTPKVTTGIKDANGNTIIGMSPAASAVSYLAIGNAATGAAVTAIATSASETNIGVQWKTKGTGLHIFSKAGLTASGISRASTAGGSVIVSVDTDGGGAYVENVGASGTGGGGALYMIADDGAALGSGHRIGLFLYSGSVSASARSNCASIEAFAESAWSASSAPTYLKFSTAPSGSTSRTERLRISSAGVVTIAGDTLVVATAKTPANATDTGVAGQHAWDASYLYICTAANTWRRVAHATW